MEFLKALFQQQLPREPPIQQYFQQTRARILERKFGLKDFSKITNATNTILSIASLRNKKLLNQAISAHREITPWHQMQYYNYYETSEATVTSLTKPSSTCATVRTRRHQKSTEGQTNTPLTEALQHYFRAYCRIKNICAFRLLLLKQNPPQ